MIKFDNDNDNDDFISYILFYLFIFIFKYQISNREIYSKSTSKTTRR